MDDQLRERLTRWHDQIEVLKEVEFKALSLEASEKSFYSELFLATEGSIAQRDALVRASQPWKDFQAGLVAAQSEYNHAKRLLELKQSAYQASYIHYKIEAEAIKKAG